jgi:hypothetical protein
MVNWFFRAFLAWCCCVFCLANHREPTVLQVLGKPVNNAFYATCLLSVSDIDVFSCLDVHGNIQWRTPVNTNQEFNLKKFIAGDKQAFLFLYSDQHNKASLYSIAIKDGAILWEQRIHRKTSTFNTSIPQLSYDRQDGSVSLLVDNNFYQLKSDGLGNPKIFQLDAFALGLETHEAKQLVFGNLIDQHPTESSSSSSSSHSRAVATGCIQSPSTKSKSSTSSLSSTICKESFILNLGKGNNQVQILKSISKELTIKSSALLTTQGNQQLLLPLSNGHGLYSFHIETPVEELISKKQVTIGYYYGIATWEYTSITVDLTQYLQSINHLRSSQKYKPQYMIEEHQYLVYESTPLLVIVIQVTYPDQPEITVDEPPFVLIISPSTITTTQQRQQLKVLYRNYEESSTSSTNKIRLFIDKVASSDHLIKKLVIVSVQDPSSTMTSSPTQLLEDKVSYLQVNPKQDPTIAQLISSMSSTVSSSAVEISIVREQYGIFTFMLFDHYQRFAMFTYTLSTSQWSLQLIKHEAIAYLQHVSLQSNEEWQVSSNFVTAVKTLCTKVNNNNNNIFHII